MKIKNILILSFIAICFIGIGYSLEDTGNIISNEAITQAADGTQLFESSPIVEGNTNCYENKNNYELLCNNEFRGYVFQDCITTNWALCKEGVCNDSDNGINTAVRGRTTSNFFDPEFASISDYCLVSTNGDKYTADSCSSEQNCYQIESFCENNKISNIGTKVTLGTCYDGVIVPPPCIVKKLEWKKTEIKSNENAVLKISSTDCTGKEISIKLVDNSVFGFVRKDAIPNEIKTTPSTNEYEYSISLNKAELNYFLWPKIKAIVIPNSEIKTQTGNNLESTNTLKVEKDVIQEVNFYDNSNTGSNPVTEIEKDKTLTIKVSGLNGETDEYLCIDIDSNTCLSSNNKIKLKDSSLWAYNTVNKVWVGTYNLNDFTLGNHNFVFKKQNTQININKTLNLFENQITFEVKHINQNGHEFGDKELFYQTDDLYLFIYGLSHLTVIYVCEEYGNENKCNQLNNFKTDWFNNNKVNWMKKIYRYSNNKYIAGEHRVYVKKDLNSQPVIFKYTVDEKAQRTKYGWKTCHDLDLQETLCPQGTILDCKFEPASKGYILSILGPNCHLPAPPVPPPTPGKYGPKEYTNEYNGECINIMMSMETWGEVEVGRICYEDYRYLEDIRNYGEDSITKRCTATATGYIQRCIK